jgi:hypothetical protein
MDNSAQLNNMSFFSISSFEKVLLCNSIVLLLAALSVMHVKVEGQVTTANPTTANPTTANPTTANPTTGETTQFTTQKRTTERSKSNFFMFHFPFIEL